MSKHPPRDPRRRRSPNLPVSLQAGGLHPRSSGYAAQGPGFYVWDDYAVETRRRASELRQVAPRPRPTRV